MNIPFDEMAEKTVLGALLTSPRFEVAYDDVGLRSEDFYIAAHQVIYTGMVQLYNQSNPIDFVTVSELLKGNDLFKGVEYLSKLAADVPTTRHLEYYAKIVKEKSQRRQYIKAAHELASLAADNTADINTVIDTAEQILIKNADDNSGMDPISDVLGNVFDNLVDAYNNKGRIPGQRTGWNTFDVMVGGLEKGNLIVIGGRPAMGKSIFGTNIAEYVSFKEGKPALIFSLEMPKAQVGLRITSSQSYSPFTDCRFGLLKEDDFKAIGNFIAEKSNAPLFINDRSAITVQYVRSVARRIKRKYGQIGVIVIDYLQLMRGAGKWNNNRTEEVAEISRGLKQIAKELDCPIIALSQLSRNVETRANKRPMMADLRESGSIEQDADTIAFLYRDEYYSKDSNKKGIAEVIIAKARSGETGTIELSFQPHIMRFVEIEEIKAMKKRGKE